MKLENLVKHAAAIKNFLSKENHISIYPNYGVIVDAIVNEFPGQNMLIVRNTEREAQELKRIFPDALLNPEFGLYPYEIDFTQSSRIQDKISFLKHFYVSGRHIVISTLKGLFDPILTKGSLYEGISSLVPGTKSVTYEIVVRKNANLSESFLIENLARFVYKRVTEVTERGEFSVKGNIIDIYTFGYDNPIRIVFGFENVVEEIKFFDMTNFKSFETLSEVTILPNTYYLFDKSTMEKFEAKVIKELSNTSNEYLKDSVLNDLEEIRKTGNFGINFYFKFISSGKNLSFPTLIDQTEDFIKIFIQPLHEDEFLKDSKEIFTTKLKTMETLPADLNSIKKGLDLIGKGKIIELLPLPRDGAIELPITSEPSNFPFLTNSIKDYILTTLKEKSVLIATEQVERVKELLKMYELTPKDAFSERIDLYILKRHFEKGVETDNLVVLTDRELFLHYEPTKGKSKVISVKGIENVGELSDGDLVVHRDFGIGIFRGLIKLTSDGVKEYLLIEYRDGERLYVPLERIGFVDKYIGDRRFVPLNRLGSNDWKNAKDKAKESAKELAKSLLTVQAERKIHGGFSFRPFPNEERILALSFPYELTEDQEKALSEVYEDMESPEPMERLICGDVGYGKTEIAIRAAGRAVMNGKQAVVLVPTTILALQHERTFKERLRFFPVEVAMLSRLTDTKKTKEIIEGLKKGSVDIVIGTHKLFSRDIKFKDLGLLIIDEEQKFGVKDKEKIRLMRANIDLMTLTATPIPRTLHSALLKLKSVSLIVTPPTGRIPVKTFVLPFNINVMREAIKTELSRSGQVFVVHNKIEDLYSFTQRIKETFPESKIAVVHGQMKKEEIEKVMVSFYEGDVNVLVSTTIIENGLDIPTVNTLIVDNAQNFGLSDMYQLRGRVGRSVITAFAYFFYEEKSLQSIAEERLETIKEFSGEGSGIKIAMKDLELRGAGDLLGKEQHGHIVSVGYNMYITLLEEAVSELKGETRIKANEVPVRLNESFYIDDRYIPVNTERLGYYKRITSSTSIQEIENIREELIDRFGKPGQEVENLLKVGIITRLARNIGVKEIFQEGKRVFLSISEGSNIDAFGIQMLTKEKNGVRFGEDYISFEIQRSPLNETSTVLNLLNGEKYAKVDN